MNIELWNDCEYLRRSQLEASRASGMLARAFCGTATTDPDLAYDWCLGPELMGKWDDAGRYNAQKWMWRNLLEQAWSMGPRGAVVIIRDPDNAKVIIGIAICKVYPSSFEKHTDGMFVGVKAHLASGKQCKEGIAFMKSPRKRALDKAFKKLHARACPRPHLRLVALGVAPGSQSQDVGDKLISSVCNIADVLDKPCYIECTGPRSQAYFKKRGFDVAGAIMITVPPNSSGDKERVGAEGEECEFRVTGMIKELSGKHHWDVPLDPVTLLSLEV